MKVGSSLLLSRYGGEMEEGDLNTPVNQSTSVLKTGYPKAT